MRVRAETVSKLIRAMPTLAAPPRAARPGGGRLPLGSARYVLTHARLLWRMSRHDLHARYAASLLGPAWVFFGPVLLLTLYGLVYRAVFRVSAPGMDSTEYVLYIFAGLVPYLMTAEALSVAVTSVVRNAGAIGNTVFPIDLAPVRAVLSTLPTLAVGVAIVLVGAAATGNLESTFALVPVVALLHVLGLVGVAWILSLVTVVFRDLEHLLAAILVVLLVASPIAYTPEMVPEAARLLVYLNPFALVVLAYQDVMVVGDLPTPAHAAALVAVSLGAFAVGAAFFAWAKRAALDYV